MHSLIPMLPRLLILAFCFASLSGAHAASIVTRFDDFTAGTQSLDLTGGIGSLTNTFNETGTNALLGGERGVRSTRSLSAALVSSRRWVPACAGGESCA